MSAEFPNKHSRRQKVNADTVSTSAWFLGFTDRSTTQLNSQVMKNDLPGVIYVMTKPLIIKRFFCSDNCPK